MGGHDASPDVPEKIVEIDPEFVLWADQYSFNICVFVGKDFLEDLCVLAP